MNQRQKHPRIILQWDFPPIFYFQKPGKPTIYSVLSKSFTKNKKQKISIKTLNSFMCELPLHNFFSLVWNCCPFHCHLFHNIIFTGVYHIYVLTLLLASVSSVHVSLHTYCSRSLPCNQREQVHMELFTSVTVQTFHHRIIFLSRLICQYFIF